MKNPARPATGRTIINAFIFILSGIVIPLSLPAQETQKNEPAVKVERPKIEYTAGELVDPFQPLELKKEEPKKPLEAVVKAPRPKVREVPFPALKVQGLIWGGRLPQAIINNKIVTIGDIIEGASVESIEKERITLVIEGDEFNIPTPSAEAVVSKKP
jgi:hypothetical protein